MATKPLDLEPDRRNLATDERLMAMYGRYLGKLNVNVGSALNHFEAPGKWINVDLNPKCKPDIVCDARFLAQALGRESVDAVLASHFLEHLNGYEDLFTVFDQFWQVLKPGGHVLAFVPHGSSDISWEDPFHKLRFSVETFPYLCDGMYTTRGNAGYGADQGVVTHPWEIVVTTQVPFQEWAKECDAMLELASRRYRNVVREIHCVMRKVGR